MIGVLSKAASIELLQSNVVGRIGCGDGTRIYIVPVQYVFDRNSVLAHSVEGMKIHMMRKHPDTCFEVDEIKDLQNWKSVIAWGRYQEIITEHERYEAIRLFVERHIKLKISETAMMPGYDSGQAQLFNTSGIRPVFYRIIIEEITGRFEKN